ncbi:LemA protein [Pedobacter westerhofensis]|uniref:LemA protein n=1 Tax=Pedobacter westerhofensis TaxID=425512 RepID=A0A521AGP6_9SPHI|nr:LemA family protein [Pedobacter westerhofensis]SMO33987.1 LemA protein [Pedobacter westerhofensis]
MTGQTIALIVGILLIIIALGFIIGIYNKLVMLKNNIEKAFKNIDVILMQRAEEIPELVKITSKYVAHETMMLTRLTELRTAVLNSGTIDEKIAASGQLGRATKELFAVSENYPALLSNNNFLELQKRVSVMEDKIADRREYYNDSVNLYNIGIEEFPNVILAGLLGYKQRNLFTVLPEEKEYHGVQL